APAPDRATMTPRPTTVLAMVVGGTSRTGRLAGRPRRASTARNQATASQEGQHDRAPHGRASISARWARSSRPANRGLSLIRVLERSLVKLLGESPKATRVAYAGPHLTAKRCESVSTANPSTST